jgi:four helix bundle protein
MALQTFEDLEVWQRGCRLAVDVFAETNSWKSFVLKDQIQRAALSIPSNIAEGSERDSDGDFVRFLRISKASSAELRTQLYIAKKLNEKNADLFPAVHQPFVAETKEISAMIQGLIRSIERRKHG